MTKDGVLAGPRLLEHMVDTVISLEGDRRQMFRLLRVFKNRFGPNEELLVFRMTSRNALNSALRKLNKACEQRKL